MRIAAAMLLFAVGLVAQAGSGLDQGYQQLYNLQFASAHASFTGWIEAHPEDPLGPASDAAVYLFAEFERLHVLQAQFFSDNATFLSGPAGITNPAFPRELAASEALAAAALARSPADLNALYSQALCHGLRADDLAILHKQNWAAVQEMKRGQAVAEHLLALDPDYGDAYLALGIENYILGQRAPPVRWLLRLNGASTNQAAGIVQLQQTAAHGRYLAPFAQILLALAALRAHQTGAARDLLRHLSARFPANPLFSQEVARLGEATATLDAEHSRIQFTLGAFLHTVHGTFAVTNGRLQWDPASGAATGKVVVAAASGQSGDTGRDRDMREKVLLTDQYPEIVFVPQLLQGRVAPAGRSTVMLRGTLTLLGVDHPIEVPLTVTVSGPRFTARGQVVLPYVAWGLKNPSRMMLRVDKQVTLGLDLGGMIGLPQPADGGGL